MPRACHMVLIFRSLGDVGICGTATVCSTPILREAVASVVVWPDLSTPEAQGRPAIFQAGSRPLEEACIQMGQTELRTVTMSVYLLPP